MTSSEQYFLSRYFFCGYQIVDNWELTEEQKRLRAMNTFLLALDGDVDFRPEAILKVRLKSKQTAESKQTTFQSPSLTIVSTSDGFGLLLRMKLTNLKKEKQSMRFSRTMALSKSDKSDLAKIAMLCSPTPCYRPTLLNGTCPNQNQSV